MPSLKIRRIDTSNPQAAKQLAALQNPFADQAHVVSGANATLLRPVGSAGSNGTAVFGASVPCAASGQYGFSVRVLPRNPDLPNPYEPGLVTWG